MYRVLEYGVQSDGAVSQACVGRGSLPARRASDPIQWYDERRNRGSA